MGELRRGDPVTWRSHGEKVEGTVERRITRSGEVALKKLKRKKR